MSRQDPPLSKKIITSLRVRLWLATFSNKIFKICTFFRLNAIYCTLNRPQYSVKHDFHMHWETPKFLWLTSLQCLLYCGHLELNLQYLWGMPIIINANCCALIETYCTRKYGIRVSEQSFTSLPVDSGSRNSLRITDGETQWPSPLGN